MIQDGDIDYSRYSLDELFAIRGRIDADKYPLNHQNLLTEIDRRGGQSSAPPAVLISGESPAEQTGCATYALAGASFIPLVGFLLGPVTVLVAFVGDRRHRNVAAGLGVAGFLFNVLLYGSLYYFGVVSSVGPWIEPKRELSQHQLERVVKDLEFFRVQHGHYPQHLEEMNSEFTMDVFSGTSGQPLVYELSQDGSTYHLFSRGPDQTERTADDIHPDIPENEQNGIGYRLPDQ